MILSPAIPPWKYQFSFDHWSQAWPGVVSTWMGDRLGIVTLFFIIHLLYIRLNVLPYPKDHLYLWPTSTFSIVRRVVHYYRRLYSLYKNKGHFIISNKLATSTFEHMLYFLLSGELSIRFSTLRYLMSKARARWKIQYLSLLGLLAKIKV